MSFYVATGYLPAPFIHDRYDTYMDWYNTVYWAHNPGAYDEWLSVYPPFSFEFLKILSIPRCYEIDPLIGRDCDPIGLCAIFGFFLANMIVVYLAYRDMELIPRLSRWLALCIGMPMLFALERGNLLIPCFTFFVLGNSKILKSAFAKWLCVAVTINFKPYLILTILGRLLQGRWRWVEGCALVTIFVYLLSYILEGAGDPITLVRNILLFGQSDVSVSLNNIFYASSFSSIIRLLKSDLPIMAFVSSKPLEFAQAAMPMLILLGQLGILSCLAGAIWFWRTLSMQRLGGLAMTLFLITTNPGGYVEIFLIYVVFLEKLRGAGLIIALVSAYLLCIPWDYSLFKIAHQIEDSYLSNRTVGYDLSVTVGTLVRPALVLAVGLGLVWASLGDMYRALRSGYGREDLITAPCA